MPTTTVGGRVCRTCRTPKPWAEFAYRTGPGKGRRAQCKACDETNPVPGTADEWMAAEFPADEAVPPVIAELMREAFEAGRRAAALGYAPRKPALNAHTTTEETPK
jgi:hypothetical protein